MRTVKSYSNGLPQVFTFGAATLTRGGAGNKTATFTATVPHRLTTGNMVRVVGADLWQYNTESYGSVNASVMATVTSPTSFTYLMVSAPTGNADVTNVAAQRALESNQYDPFVLVSPDNLLLVAPAGIAVAPTEGLYALATGNPEPLTTDQSIYFRKLWLYPGKVWTAGILTTPNAAVINVGKSGAAATKYLPDIINSADTSPLLIQLPEGQKMKLAQIILKGTVGDGVLYVFT